MIKSVKSISVSRLLIKVANLVQPKILKNTDKLVGPRMTTESESAHLQSIKYITNVELLEHL